MSSPQTVSATGSVSATESRVTRAFRPRVCRLRGIEGRINPGRVFDRVTNLDGVPDGYRAMSDREAIKVMIEF